MQHSFVRTLLINPNRDQYVAMLTMLDAVPDAEYEMTWCADMALALEAMLNQLHDVILLDFESDPDACHELLRAAKAQSCGTPIVCLTSTIDEELDRKAIHAGAADYLPKAGLNSALLERTIRYAIDRKRSETQLARLAHYDILTGVPNRLLFQDRLDRALQRSERGDLPFALLYIDLDGFKAVNDNFGHDKGDMLVKAIAQRLSDCVRRSDSVARIGGDEFTVLLEKVGNVSDVVAVAQKIIDVVTEPFEADGVHLRVGCSIGIAQFPDAGKTAQDLLRHADMAMYEAKGIAGSNYRFFTDKMNLQVLDQSRIESELRTAIKQDQLRLYYQPRISLRTGKVVAAEALLRWQHPDGQILLPREFLDIADQAGLLPTLGYWVLGRVCADLAQMQQTGVPPIKLSVNVALSQLLEDEFVDNVTTILKSHQVPEGRLELELKESNIVMEIAASDDEVWRAIDTLRAHGIEIVLDDFGRGLTSLATLQHRPLALLKMDSTLVRKLDSGLDKEQFAKQGDARLVKTLVSLAHSLDIQVAASGVETDAQRQFLADCRCDQLQGHVYSPPRPYDDFIDFVRGQGVTSRRSYLSVVDKS